MKLNEMGTTGLMEYVVSQRSGWRFALALANAVRVIMRRYGSEEAVRRFRGAALKMQWARLTR